MKILIIEDEPKLAAFLQQGLEENDFDTEVVYDGLMGQRMVLQHTFDMVILDVIIPHLNGLELCAIIKKEKPHLPVLMLTALGTTDDKITGLDAGADDYLVKPFEFRELLARVRALTRRTGPGQAATNQLKVADLTLDLDKKVAIRGDKTITLTAKEFGLLEYLMRNRGRVVSRVDIAEKVWDITFDTGTNVVDVYVNLLRKKIDRDFPEKLIETRVGMGYVLKA
ncbi:MAG: response regulator transcription factor [Flavobacteriales bacterium]|nr:response regulator transcription factor [Flavobacteriales bacterium]